MAELVRDWLADYQRIRGQPSEAEAFVVEHETDPEIAEAIFTIFNERQRNEALVHDICQQLLAFYRSPEQTLHKFPLQFIPVLLYTYLHSVAGGDKKAARGVETLLICIYNGEVSTEDGGQKVVAFRMPILAQTSVYHEVKNLPMTDLRRWEENCNREVKWGPHQRIESIHAQNRMRILTALLFCYNQQVSQTQKSSLLHLCRVTSQLVNQGFTTKSGHGHRMSYGSDPATGVPFPKPSSPRIPLSAAFLIELVHAIYFAMFNGFGTIAIQTLDDIHNRAIYEMYSEVILVTSAVRNSLHANPSGQPNDGPMGLSVALTPSTTTVTTSVSKSMITNASFRTKKLPDDIPIQVQDLTMPQAPQQLASVTEETEPGTKESPSTKESSGTRTSIMRPSMEGIKAQAHKALIAGFKKSKDKEKEKDKEPPKPPQRKFDKHTQRNSLLQLQAEPSSNSSAEQPPTGEVLPLQTLSLINENGSNSFSVDSDLNDGVLGVSANTSLPPLSSTTNSVTSSDLITKSFDSSIELAPMGHSSSNGGKLAEHGLVE
ncbi:hyccin [Drosophila sechellia]|uniref:GM19955 n=1 Tax=Drosophila sechellia TaxID=7238 RepID=B4HN67_DROSE|nr:hyccin [Drosophila sechellia]XP_032573067.1 hyccin [Drosophila sechellia]EDW48349.1 GM19955 [Drosophila sechellia]